MGRIMAWKKGWLAGWQLLLGPLLLGLLYSRPTMRERESKQGEEHKPWREHLA